jgi:hypothetical protein
MQRVICRLGAALPFSFVCLGRKYGIDIFTFSVYLAANRTRHASRLGSGLDSRTRRVICFWASLFAPVRGTGL